MDYVTIITLFSACILGIAAHAFKETDKRNKAQEPKYSIRNYWSDNKNGIMASVICSIVISYYSGDVKQIKELPAWGVGGLYFGLGYMGDSAFPSLLEVIPNLIEKFKTMIGASNKSENGK